MIVHFDPLVETVPVGQPAVLSERDRSCWPCHTTRWCTGTPHRTISWNGSHLYIRLCQCRNAWEMALRELPQITDFFGKIRARNRKCHIEIFSPKFRSIFAAFTQQKMAQKFWRENFFVTFPGTPGKISGKILGRFLGIPGVPN